MAARKLPPGYLDKEAAAEQLGVEVRTLHTWRQRKTGCRSAVINGRLAYRPEWIAEYLAGFELPGRTPDPAPEAPATVRKARPDIVIPRQHNRRAA